MSYQTAFDFELGEEVVQCTVCNRILEDDPTAFMQDLDVIDTFEACGDLEDCHCECCLELE